MTRIPQVVLIVETSTHFGRAILGGIADFLRSHRPWTVFVEQRSFDSALPLWLENWRGDGIISRTSTPAFTALVRNSGIPTVDLTHRDEPFGLPRISIDDHAIGRTAAEHLRDRGFRELAFCGFTGIRWSVRRKEGFLASDHGPGAVEPGRVFELSWNGLEHRSWDVNRAEIGQWLRTLPRPVGILAANDVLGHHLLDTCRQVALQVPDEAAVLGVNDDPVLCELSAPPLSSVRTGAERIGYEAAKLLDQLMEGETPSSEERLIPPLGVTTRQSTDTLAIDDPRIAAAVRFIREHACQGINVQDVLDQVTLSRTSLERCFRKYLGRSPQAEIRVVQLKRVRQLLADTEFKLHRIAELTGFEHREYLSVLFKREFGQTPGEFRREARSRPASS